LPLFDGLMESRPTPIGFWQYPEDGVITPSAQWMAELLEAQASDPEAIPDSARLHLDAGDLSRQYAENVFPGHAAWLDWPCKLHRIEDEGGETTFELYNLESDPDESVDLVADQTSRVESMKNDLATWQRSVVRSLNGEDYR
jgi:hypothetical protein